MKTPVAFTPWRSIREGAIGVTEQMLSADAALESPCIDCRSTPCCTHLLLHTFTLERFIDLWYARFLLNFDHIRLAVNPEGRWDVFYTYPCANLDPETYRCRVHDTPEQPSICVNYNSYTCFYRPTMTVMAHPRRMMIDRTRLEVVAQHVVFDENRNVAAMPEWSDLCAVLADVADPVVEKPSAPIEDPAWDEWQAVAIGRKPPAPPAEPIEFGAALDPCSTCSAPCCDTLSFERPVPVDTYDVEKFRYAINFPGIEVAITEQTWSLVVKTRCRHFQRGRCSVFGKPERPPQCSHFDALTCTVRLQFASPMGVGSVRARRAEFATILSGLRFDQHGQIVRMPNPDMYRRVIEHGWAEAATEEAARPAPPLRLPDTADQEPHPA